MAFLFTWLSYLLMATTGGKDVAGVVMALAYQVDMVVVHHNDCVARDMPLVPNSRFTDNQRKFALMLKGSRQYHTIDIQGLLLALECQEFEKRG